MNHNQWLNRALILIPIVIGIAVVVLASILKSPPQKNRVTEIATIARNQHTGAIAYPHRSQSHLWSVHCNHAFFIPDTLLFCDF